MVEPKKLASDIYEKVKAHKIIDFNNCLTRLRIKFDKNDLPDINEIKKIVGVINVVKIGSEYQIILGPGIVDKVSAEMKNIVTNTQTSESVVKQTQPLSTNTQNCDTQSSNQKTFDDNKKRFKNNFISQTLSRFAKIFSPLIPAFVGAGILAGIACIIQIAAGITQDPSKNPAAEQWYQFFQVCLGAWSAGFLIIVGWRFCEMFGGKPYLGGVFGCMFSVVAATAYAALYSADAGNGISGTFLGIHIDNISTNWLTIGLAHEAKSAIDGSTTYSIGSPLGSMFGLIICCVGSIYFEKFLSSKIHSSISFVVTPIITLLTMLVLNIFLIFPISGYIIYGITWLFEHITTGHAAPFGDFILTFAFLFLLILGLQTSLIPIYIALLASAPLNLNTIFPLLGMAGPGQVGAALALMITSSKKSNFRKTTLPSLISGVLGIDEPLLYGMNLPRIAPLFTSALAAGCAGFFIGGMQDWVGINMGVQSVYGVNGIWGIFTVTSEKGANIYWPKVVYCAGFMISIILGFVFTKIGYHIFKNNKKINWDLN